MKNIETEYVKIDNEKFFEVIKTLLDNEKFVRIAVRGGSMYPFLRNLTDSVELHKAEYENIKNFDIVLVQKDSAYILHRVFKKSKKKFFMLGDGNTEYDGPYTKDDFICKAVYIYRKNKKLPCDLWYLKSLAVLWYLIKPLRKVIIYLYMKMRAV